MKDELTLEELKQRIVQQMDELYLLELLNITTEELVDRLTDDIIDNFDKIKEALE